LCDKHDDVIMIIWWYWCDKHDDEILWCWDYDDDDDIQKCWCVVVWMLCIIESWRNVHAFIFL